MATPVSNFKNRLKYAIGQFESDTGKTVKNVKLVRLDQPIIHKGETTDLVDIEITIK